MQRRFVFALFAAALVLPALAARPTSGFAAEKLSGQPSAAEAPFVAKAVAVLSARFPTPAAARRAGYLRFTDEDDTGAISYANRQWTSADVEHPSQLWFDASDHLIGADYSVPVTGKKPPELFGLRPDRWQKFGLHAHYGLVGPNGTIYGGVGDKTLAKGGASSAKPTARALVRAGIAKNVNDVRFVFTFPSIWDVSIWLVPNPNGAFAEKNPDVKPVNPPKEMKM